MYFMTIHYLDNNDIVSADVDFHNVQFSGSRCYFASGGEEYNIDSHSVIEIELTKQIGDDEYTTNF